MELTEKQKLILCITLLNSLKVESSDIFDIPIRRRQELFEEIINQNK